MKKNVKDLLKAQFFAHHFTEEKYHFVKNKLMDARKKDKWLNNFCRLDPYNKAVCIADHIVSLSLSKSNNY